MTTAERLTAIANNVPLVYEAGVKAGQTPVESKDINFHDYDGTLLYSYTLDEIQALTELPPLPSQPGLICQEWNWSLDELKSLGRPMTVGATYTTDDGATRIHIDIYDELLLDTTLKFKQTVANGVTVNWGDGSATQKSGGTGNITLQHSYTKVGKYTIALTPIESCTLTLGHASYNATLLTSDAANSSVGKRSVAYEINMGDRCITSFYAFLRFKNLKKFSMSKGEQALGEALFSGCANLMAFIFPRTVQSIGISALNGCYSMSVVSLSGNTKSANSTAFSACAGLNVCEVPDGFTFGGSSNFNNAYGLEKIYLPDSVTKITNSMFYGCASLKEFVTKKADAFEASAFNGCMNLFRVTIPNTCTQIKGTVFQSCSSLKAVHFESISPPTLSADAATSVFSGVSSACVFYVPKGSLAAYQAATNYASIADRLQEERE